MTRLFVCEQCDCVDHLDLAPSQSGPRLLCSLCHPQRKEWHNQFPHSKYLPASDIVCNRPSGVSLG